MSERLTTTRPGISRPDRRWRRFRDLPIWSKLGVIMIVPTIATIVVGTNGLVNSIDTASNADRSRTLANLSGTAAELVHALQNERANAVMLLGAPEDQVEARSAAYVETQGAVDGAERQFQTQSASITDVPATFRDLVSNTQGQLALLPQTRTRVTERTTGLIDTANGYEELIVNLIGIRDASTQLAGDVELGDRMRAAAEISNAKEFLSQLRVIGHEVLARGVYQPHLRNAFIGAQTGFDQSLEAFEAVASSGERAELEQVLGGPVVRQSTLYQFQLHSLEGSQLDGLTWDAGAWDETLAAQADLLRELETSLDTEIVSQATALRDEITQRVLVETGVLLGMLLAAILLAWLVARSMARSLRDLRQGALSVAQYGLPQAVARLRDPAISTQQSPAQVAHQIAEPLPVRSKDEFGQVAEAFNAVHLEAVRTAAEQAQLRSSVATMFVNLARRSQILVDRLINHLDRLERGEEDPDRLAELFQLDHLATRMRRNDENLLVLAGADSTRVQRDAAPLIDVLRAAQSEVEHYTRIEFGVVDRDLEVAAHAVNDLVHLIAELFDNATTFSAPESQVMVEARRVGDRAVLYVEDRGLGLSPEQLAEINERLATPPMVDVAVSRMMGLVVVSRLAARHGVKVELRPAVSHRGTIADVTLPASVLVPRGLAGRPEPAGELSLRGDGRPPEQRGLSTRPYPPPPTSPAPLPPPPSHPPGPRHGPPSQPFLPPAVPAPQLPPRDAPPPPPPPRMPALPARARGALPAWSDLTGASHAAGTNGASLPPGVPPAAPMPPSVSSSGMPPPSSSPLPRRRPGGGVDGDLPPQTGTDGLIPRPRPSEWPGEPAGDRQDRWPVERGPQAPQPELPQPPPWPPIMPETTTALPAGPAVRPLGQLPPAAPPRIPVPVSDETQELPIFREVESAWFRTRQGDPEPDQPRADQTETAELATVPAGGPPTIDADSLSGTAQGGWPGSTEPGWRTAADDGWRAASSLSEMDVEERTPAGLPKRRPMAQLVPGGVERASAAAQRRSPEAVRGLLSAYHRGVQRGREQTIEGEPGGGTQPQSTEERGT